MVAGKLAAPRGRFDIGALIAHPANSLNLISRQAIKKYVKANNKVQFTSETQFDSMFNKALKSGVEKGEFTQPKGQTLTPSHETTRPFMTCCIPSLWGW